LAVRVAPSGVKTWDLAYRIRGSGKVRRVSLGRVSDVTLEKARERANELTVAARAGRDLIAEQKESRAAAERRLTVQKVIELYVRRRVAGRLRTAKEIERRLRRALSPILQRPADDIRRRDIRELLDAVADSGAEREAEKRRQTVGAMFRWALSQDLVETNPAAGLKAYDPGTPRERVLSVEEIEALWKWLDAGALPPDQTDILKIELLTGARCGEISGLRAEEIDRDDWTWTLPATRSKNKRPRVTPVVGVARQIIEARLSGSEAGPVFTAETGAVMTSGHVGHLLWARSDKLPIAKFTTHDLRRTAATMLAEMGVSLDLVAAIVGHEAGGKETRTLVRHYIRTDLIERKAHALHAWDERLRDIVTGREAGKILRVQIRSGVEDLDGAQAVLLWHRYLRGDVGSLRRLIHYNRCDVVAMRHILDEILERRVRAPDFWFATSRFSQHPHSVSGWALQGAELPSCARQCDIERARFCLRLARRSDDDFVARGQAQFDKPTQSLEVSPLDDQLDVELILGINERVNCIDQVLDDAGLAIKRHHHSVHGEFVVCERRCGNFRVARNRRHGSQHERGRKGQPKRGGRNRLQNIESCNPEKASRRRNRSNRGNLRTGHSAPGGESSGQTTERNIEDRFAVVRAHKAGEPLRRGQGKRA